VATLHVDGVGSEGVIGSILGSGGTEVLLAEALEVVLNGVGSLRMVLEALMERAIIMEIQHTSWSARGTLLSFIL
jgi:hypothetical protein